MKNIYLNNAATTRIKKTIAKKLYKLEKYHSLKNNKLNLIYKKYKQKLAHTLHCNTKEILWTSGATESNNIAIKGLIKPDDTVITSHTEHDSIYKTIKSITNNIIKINTYNTKQFLNIITLKKIALVTIYYVNNETGKLNNVKPLSQICNQHKIPIHIDATQATGKIKINLKTLKVNLMTITSHKSYGPKNIGILYINKNIFFKLKPTITGGNQQTLRPGTLSKQLKIGACAAIIYSYKNLTQINTKITKLNTLLLRQLEFNFKNNYNYIKGQKIPHITCIWIKNLDSQIILKQLKNITIANKAKCTKTDYSNKFINIKKYNNIYKLLFRISISKNNKYCEIIQLTQQLKTIYKKFTHPLIQETQ